MDEPTVAPAPPGTSGSTEVLPTSGGPGPEPTPGAATRPPSRALPITLVVVGALLVFPGSVLAWFASFVLGLSTMDAAGGELTGEIPSGGAITLEAGETYVLSPYELYPSDAGTAPGGPVCGVTGPDGADVPVWTQTVGEGPDAYEEGPLVTPTVAGEHTVECTLDGRSGDLMISVLPRLATEDGLGDMLVPALVAGGVALLGLVLLTVGIVQLVRANRRRRAWARGRRALAVPTAGRPGDPGTDGAPGPAPTPRPVTDPRVRLTPENAFGSRTGGRPPSMVPAVVSIVLGALLLVGGPVAGVLAPVVAVLADPEGAMAGGTISNGESLELPADSEVYLGFAEDPASLPSTDEEWQTYTPPPVPPCRITDPDGAPVTAEVDSQGGFESATMTTTAAGTYSFECEMDDRYAGTIDAFATPASEAGIPTALLVGLAVGALGLALLITGIVLAVRTSARRQDAGL